MRACRVAHGWLASKISVSACLHPHSYFPGVTVSSYISKRNSYFCLHVHTNNSSHFKAVAGVTLQYRFPLLCWYMIQTWAFSITALCAHSVNTTAPSVGWILLNIQQSPTALDGEAATEDWPSILWWDNASWGARAATDYVGQLSWGTEWGLAIKMRLHILT